MKHAVVLSLLSLASITITLPSHGQIVQLGNSTSINAYHDGVMIGQVDTVVQGVRGLYGFTKKDGQPMTTYTFSGGATTSLMDQKEIAGKGQCTLGVFTSTYGFNLQGFLSCPTETQQYDFGDNYTIPRALLKNGTVVGYYDVRIKSVGFIIDASGFRSYQVPGAEQTEILTANDDGRMAGRYLTADGKYHGFILAPDGTVTTVDKPGAGNSAIVAINSQCALGFYGNQNVQSAFLHCPKGGYKPIPLGFVTWPTVLLEDGTIAGYFEWAGGNNVGFVWRAAQDQP
ncbi:MAG TPA: hypothetical protein VKR60_14275 [Candidatus Sulfotelmatobacter sp.]|nr:hypothetical protein [Candidatus Sulfotelmatobacter sp.]